MNLQRTAATIFILATTLWYCATAWGQKNASDQGVRRDTTAVAQTDSARYKSPSRIMIRSMLVPGWGQFTNGKKWKGITAVTADFVTLGGFLIESKRIHDSKTEEQRSFYRERRNTYLIWFVGITLYSMADAYVDAQLRDFGKGEEDHISVALLVNSVREIKLVGQYQF